MSVLYSVSVRFLGENAQLTIYFVWQVAIPYDLICKALYVPLKYSTFLDSLLWYDKLFADTGVKNIKHPPNNYTLSPSPSDPSTTVSWAWSLNKKNLSISENPIVLLYLDS